MAEPLSAGSAPQLVLLVSDTFQEPPKTYFKGGSGGGPTVDRETERHIDTRVEAMKAQNDARFAEVLAEVRSVGDRVSHIGAPMTWQQLALTAGSVGLVLMGVVFSVLSYASDRFDGGIAASGLLDVMQAQQSQRDIVQDAKLDEILNAVSKWQAPPASQP